jgi:exoribonuclease-2
MPKDDRAQLSVIARRAMLERGMEPAFSPEAQRELAAIHGPAQPGADVRDLRDRLWASIDNDDSRDLDQLTVAEPMEKGRVRILVGIADVDALVHKGSAIDDHAAANTTSVYTPATIFPMLPEPLSTGLTSLNEDQDRLAVVVDMVFEGDGALAGSELYRAHVRNHAKLAYNGVAAWLSGQGPAPQALAAVRGLDQNLRVQDGIADKLAQRRHEKGALTLESLEPKAVFDGDAMSKLVLDQKNRAKQIIEDFMIAANGVTASFLEAKGFASLRRVLKAPERWDRIRELAGRYGDDLPGAPDAVALDQFLDKRRLAEPEKFPDLSLSVIKLIGRGEYAVDRPGRQPQGHFGLAVRDYTHSTAPNRRFPDLITQRLLKAAMAGARAPYSDTELEALATHCTKKEDDATKVERLVTKSAAALLLSDRVGDTFEGIVTGVSDKGTWVRIFQPPVEGRLERGNAGVDVGDRITVKLIHTDVNRGFIDFERR